MKKAIVLIALLSLSYSLFPLTAFADTADDCGRVGTLIDRVQLSITRAEPIIMRSGNRQAISLLNEAISYLHAAQRAYNNDLCRAALDYAQNASSLLRRALRLVNAPDIN
jgi:hypothetical protein